MQSTPQICGSFVLGEAFGKDQGFGFAVLGSLLRPPYSGKKTMFLNTLCSGIRPRQ